MFPPRGRCLLGGWGSAVLQEQEHHVLPAWRSSSQPLTPVSGKSLGIVEIQVNSPALLTLGRVQTALKGEEMSPPMSLGSGSAPGLLLSPSPGSAPIEADEIIPRHNGAHCQEDFNDIQPSFPTSSDHPIIPTYGSLSPFSRDPIPHRLTPDLAGMKEPGSHCHLHCSEAAATPPVMS